MPLASLENTVCCSVLQCVAVCWPRWTSKRNPVLSKPFALNPCPTPRDITIRNTLQHTVAHCSTLQCTLTNSKCLAESEYQNLARDCMHILPTHITFQTTQHTATDCILTHATQCNTTQHTATYCNLLQHTALSSTCRVVSQLTYATYSTQHTPSPAQGEKKTHVKNIQRKLQLTNVAVGAKKLRLIVFYGNIE